MEPIKARLNKTLNGVISNWPLSASFVYFRLFNAIDNNKCLIPGLIHKCWWLDSNRGLLVSEATTPPTVQQQLPLHDVNTYLCAYLHLLALSVPVAVGPTQFWHRLLWKFATTNFRTCVLERRHIVGGAAVTEEIVPGYKFSRASYLLSLLRPRIFNDLELKRHGLKIYLRNPSSYTPLLPEFQTPGGPTSLTLGMDHGKNVEEVRKFSFLDSERLGAYEEQLRLFVEAVDPLLDVSPPNVTQLHGGVFQKLKVWPQVHLNDRVSFEAPWFEIRPIVLVFDIYQSYLHLFFLCKHSQTPHSRLWTNITVDGWLYFSLK